MDLAIAQSTTHFTTLRGRNNGNYPATLCNSYLLKVKRQKNGATENEKKGISRLQAQSDKQVYNI